ncbi:hypothetical protein [Microbulbifer taiwanensis]|uniref:hypothetical protein n=1 Tax=Microbulbifer taiwanensis TaxID=986746 RepID=UPI00366F0244
MGAGYRRFFLSTFLSLSAFCLAACSGGGGGDSSNSGNDNDNNYNEPVGWQSGVFQPADDFANRCESPRSGIDPATDAPYKDIRGTALDERNWLRSWSNDFYLWYDEIADRDPANHGTHEYFDLLKTTELSSTGAKRTNFIF